MRTPGDLVFVTLQARDRNLLTADLKDVPGWNKNDATFIMVVNTPLGGEYQLANGWGAEAAVNVFQVSKNFLFHARGICRF